MPYNTFFPISNPTEEQVTIVEPLRETTTKESATVTLKCKVSEPDAVVTWLRDGKPITADENCTITVDGDVHKLTYKKAELEDEAEYTIKTANDQSTAMLWVEGKKNVMLSFSYHTWSGALLHGCPFNVTNSLPHLFVNCT